MFDIYKILTASLVDRRWPGTIMALAAICLAGNAGAQNYPTKPITLVVPFAAGGPADALTRNLSVALGKQLKQPVIVENVGGVGGSIGGLRVARAPADGYTIMYQNLGMVLGPALIANLGYDPVTDFDHLGVMTVSFTTLIARANMPFANFNDFIAHLKASGDKIMFANSGVGAITHLCGLLLADMLQTQFTMVPYKGNGPATNDLLAGRVDLMCDAAATAAPHIRAGKVRAIATAGPIRNRELPEVPTFTELGMKGMVLENWMALYAPKGLPKPVFDRLAEAVQGSLRDPDFAGYLDKVGYTAVPPAETLPAAQARRAKSEVERWGKLLREAGIKPQ
jgi:tripartite-type tricarboxylate transporter receptor subunit TctC